MNRRLDFDSEWRERSRERLTDVYQGRIPDRVPGYTVEDFAMPRPGEMYFDPELIIPEPHRSLRQGAIAPWRAKSALFFRKSLEVVCKHLDYDLDMPYEELPTVFKEILLHGCGERTFPIVFEKRGSRFEFTKPFEGIIANLERRYKETESDQIREELEKYMNNRICPYCQGRRLKPEILHVLIHGKSIDQLTTLSIKECLHFFMELEFDAIDREIAFPLQKEIEARLGFLVAVGLDYLTLNRTCSTLSCGEGQRIRLASQIGASLTGVLYILDEPSIGLHKRDTTQLIQILRRLRDNGNSVLVVEHDEDIINDADYVLDLGPLAGELGGELIASGSPQEIMENNHSLTGQYLSGKKTISLPTHRRFLSNRAIIIHNATGNNLKSLTASFPLGLLTCVTGVSGSGKSTLIIDTLYRAIATRLHGSKEHPLPHDKLEGVENLDKVVVVNQNPIGRTPRSNPATYTGIFSNIRDIFALLPESKIRGYKPGRYSFNVKGGRCEACKGDGIIRIEMHFLPDIFVTCDVCQGMRYNRETLAIKYRTHNIAEVLDMTVDQAANFLQSIPKILSKLQTLQAVGLGYIRLGQAATTLSGGEAQRIKLAKELSHRSTGRTLYIMDEPTTGLHLEDIHCLIEVLNRLVDAGNSIIVIEHNLNIIKVADYIIDLGPEGGELGGELVAAGTPEEIVTIDGSHTGQALRPIIRKSTPTII